VPVPLVDVRAQYERLIPQILERFQAVLESGTLILGPNVQAFEEEAAAYLGVPKTVGVANGTDALEIGAGDEVICPSFTFYATAEAIMRTGATPVFADIDPVSLNVDPEDVAAKVTERTRAIMPVHLFGRPADLAALTSLGIPIIEDAAQAFGAQGVATTGVASTFSFFPTKNLFALGDGGLVAATDEELAERVRMLRFHGSRDKKTFTYVGTNSRLDELQAAALRLFLGELDGWNRARREAAARYAELGLGEFCELPEDEPGHVYHMYVVRTPEQARLSAALFGHEEGFLPETEKASRENLALPMWAGIPAEIQERVVSVVREASTVGAAAS